MNCDYSIRSSFSSICFYFINWSCCNSSFESSTTSITFLLWFSYSRSSFNYPQASANLNSKSSISWFYFLIRRLIPLSSSSILYSCLLITSLSILCYFFKLSFSSYILTRLLTTFAPQYCRLILFSDFIIAAAVSMAH